MRGTRTTETNEKPKKTFSNNNNVTNKRLANAEISKLKKIVNEIAAKDEKQRRTEMEDDNNLEYIPKSADSEEAAAEDLAYVPSSVDLNYEEFDGFNGESSNFGTKTVHI